MMAGDDDLAALREQVALVSAAAISASDLDHAFQLQLAEAVQASLRAHSPNAASSSSSCGAAVLEPSSDLAYALALQADDLARAEQDRRDAQACRAAHALSAASVRVAAHDARFARELAAIPEDRWAHDGDYFERPLDQDSSSSSTARPLFRVLFKGMASDQVVGPRDRDPGVAVLAAAVCGPQGEVVLRIQKPVEMPLSLAGEEVLEAMALVEGLHAALGLGIHSVNVVTDNKLLHNYMLGIWRPTEQRLADMVNQALSVRKNFKRCEISLVQQSQVTYVESSSKYTAADAATLRVCVKCRGSFCISCKVPWHDRMICYDYKRSYPHARPEDAKLQNLAKQRLWRQCIKCKHMIELAEGCYHMTCVCGYEFCYTCGKVWKDKKATCSCVLWDEWNIIRNQRR
ncbi:hypothetical protein QOZ80_9BG0695380 [Eleusine coracana subsp. coracana]|nr:hypothetical protein QOZ80_9BG0695380 [Eleusine coracana subsp. coracana]